MSRSKWKPVFQAKCIQKRKDVRLFWYKIWSRSSIICKKCIGKKVLVYNGKKFVPLNIKIGMLGHKFGEFIFTKRMGRTIHIKEKKGKKGKKKGKK